jgi:hypothetical protein
MAVGSQVHNIVKHCWPFNSWWAAEIRPTKGVSGIILLTIDPTTNGGGRLRRALATARQGLRWHSGRWWWFTGIRSWERYGGWFHKISLPNRGVDDRCSKEAHNGSATLPCSTDGEDPLLMLLRRWNPDQQVPCSLLLLLLGFNCS